MIMREHSVTQEIVFNAIYFIDFSYLCVTIGKYSWYKYISEMRQSKSRTQLLGFCAMQKYVSQAVNLLSYTV